MHTSRLNCSTLSGLISVWPSGDAPETKGTEFDLCSGGATLLAGERRKYQKVVAAKTSKIAAKSPIRSRSAMLPVIRSRYGVAVPLISAFRPEGPASADCLQPRAEVKSYRLGNLSSPDGQAPGMTGASPGLRRVAQQVGRGPPARLPRGMPDLRQVVKRWSNLTTWRRPAWRSPGDRDDPSGGGSQGVPRASGRLQGVRRRPMLTNVAQ